MFKEFKKFILRGNVVDLAVGVVIGAAFNTVIQAFVKDIITPILPSGGAGEFSKASVSIGKNHIFPYGDFINTLVSFMVIAIVVFFFVVQPVNKLTTLANRSKDAEEPTEKKCPYCISAIPIDATRCKYCTATLKAAKS